MEVAGTVSVSYVKDWVSGDDSVEDPEEKVTDVGEDPYKGFCVHKLVGIRQRVRD